MSSSSGVLYDMNGMYTDTISAINQFQISVNNIQNSFNYLDSERTLLFSSLTSDLENVLLDTTELISYVYICNDRVLDKNSTARTLTDLTSFCETVYSLKEISKYDIDSIGTTEITLLYDTLYGLNDIYTSFNTSVFKQNRTDSLVSLTDKKFQALVNTCTLNPYSSKMDILFHKVSTNIKASVVSAHNIKMNIVPKIKNIKTETYSKLQYVNDITQWLIKEFLNYKIGKLVYIDPETGDIIQDETDPLYGDIQKLFNNPQPPDTINYVIQTVRNIRTSMSESGGVIDKVKEFFDGDFTFDYPITLLGDGYVETPDIDQIMKYYVDQLNKILIESSDAVESLTGYTKSLTSELTNYKNDMEGLVLQIESDFINEMKLLYNILVLINAYTSLSLIYTDKRELFIKKFLILINTDGMISQMGLAISELTYVRTHLIENGEKIVSMRDKTIEFTELFEDTKANMDYVMSNYRTNIKLAFRTAKVTLGKVSSALSDTLIQI